ncbi:MAG: MCE family protein [Gemmatimonadales bacterium]|nr:MAG: MCE family protein [Gemmatimonadales bacterium]
MTEGQGAPSNRARRTDREMEQAAPPAAGGREVRVGIFVILGILGVLAVLFLLTDPGTFRGRYSLVTSVENAGGVRSGDPVQMRGVNIGRVRDFDLVGDRVEITLEINGQWRIPQDSRARLAGAGLLGGRTVEIMPGVASESLSPGSVIPGEATADLGDLATVIGQDVEDLFARMRMLMADTTIEAVQGTAAEARALVRSLSDVVAEQRAELAATLSSVRRSAEGVEEVATSEDLRRAVARADSTMQVLQATGERLDQVSTSLGVVVGRMERGEGTLGLLSTDEALYRNLTGASASLEALLEDIRENPSRYIRLRIF